MVNLNCLRFGRSSEFWGQFAFASVIIASFAQLTLSDHLRGEPWQVLVTFALGAVYGSVAVVSTRWTDPGQPARARVAYFLFQFVLCGVLITFSPHRSYFWIIVLPLAAQGIFDLKWPWAMLLAAGLYAMSVAGIWVPYGRSAGLQATLGFAPAFIFTVIFSFLAARAMQARSRAEELSAQLAEANEQLRQQSAQSAELATIRERNRLAREIHDGLGHYLTVINVQVEAARALLAKHPERAADPLDKAARLSREALEEVRASVTNLHQDSVAPPLPARLHHLAQQAGPQVRCQVRGPVRSLPSAAEHALYRAAQEGLTNVRKHAANAPAELVLDYGDPRQVSLRVQDAGAPQAAAAAGTAGFGLRNMRERVELLGGSVHAGPDPERGFRLTVQLPG